MHEETKNNALSSVNGTIFPALKKTWVKLYSFSIDCQHQFTKTQGTFRVWQHKNPRDFLSQLGYQSGGFLYENTPGACMKYRRVGGGVKSGVAG